MGRSRPLLLYFFFSTVNNKHFLMTGFELWTSRIRSNCSAKWAIATARQFYSPRGPIGYSVISYQSKVVFFSLTMSWAPWFVRMTRPCQSFGKIIIYICSDEDNHLIRSKCYWLLWGTIFSTHYSKHKAYLWIIVAQWLSLKTWLRRPPVLVRVDIKEILKLFYLPTYLPTRPYHA